MAQKNKTLYESLLNFQKQLPDIKKDKTAGMGKFQYKYCSLENLISSIQPVLHANGLILIQPQAYNDHGQTLIVTRLIHVESGEEIKSELPLFLPENMGAKPMFAWGGSQTYSRRYAIKMLLGIEPDMDTNTEQDTELGDVKKPEKKTGISRTPTRPDSQVKKTEVKNNKFMTPAAREEIGGKISALNDSDKARVLSAFKQEFNISADQISPQHITLAAHGEFLQQAIEKLA
jgi:hypothetical protein